MGVTLVERIDVVPDEVPKKATQTLTHLDHMVFNDPPMCPTIYCMRGMLDMDRLKTAFKAVLTKNPMVRGRARNTPDGMKEVHFEGENGCPLFIKRMSADIEEKLENITFDSYCSNYLESESMFEGIGFEYAKEGAQLVTKNQPFCIMTYIMGERISCLTISISHFVADAFSVHAVTRVLHEEYCEPGSSAPLPDRQNLIDAGVKYWETHGENVNAIPDKACSFMVHAGLKEDTITALKKAELKDMPEGTRISGNDALCAWVANNLKSKYFALMTSTRGRWPGVPDGCLGNCAGGFTSDLCEKRVRATDVRKVLDTMQERLCVPKVSIPQDEIFCWNNWSKIMFYPTFEGKTYQAIPLIGMDKLAMSAMNKMHLVHMANPGEYLVLHRGLRLDQAMLLDEEWKKLGIDNAVIIWRQHAMILRDQARKMREC